MKASFPFYDPRKCAGIWLGLIPLIPAPVSFAADAQKNRPSEPPSKSFVSISELSAKEVKRRKENVENASKQVEKAEGKMASKDFDAAMQLFGKALDLLDNSPNASRERQTAMRGFQDAALQLADVRVSEGRYRTKPDQKVPSAEDALRNLLARDPNNRTAQRKLAQIYDPEYINNAITPEHREDVEKVKRYLLEGSNFLATARFDLAIKRADQVLDIDPYNAAARKLQERANVAISEIGKEAYNESRSRAMRDVQKAWASPIKRYGTVTSTTVTPQTVETSQVEKLRRKVQEIIIPEVQFTDKSLIEIAAMLTEASRSADKSGGGVLIIANFPGANPPPIAPSDSSVLTLPTPAAPAAGGSNVPMVSIPKIPNFKLSEILKIITESSQTKWTVKENWVEIVPKTTPTENLVLRNWTVSPFMFSSTAPKVDDLSSTGLGSALGGGTPAAPKSGGKRRIDPKEFLSTMNVQFTAPGSTATYNPRTKNLTVYNTPEMLDLVDSIVSDSEGQSPVQVDIRAKFIEFSQSNLKELSFDWLMGRASLPGTGGGNDPNRGVFASGGTPGTFRPSLSSSDYPFILPNSSDTNPLPSQISNYSGSPYGVFPVTSGNRSGRTAINSSAIDALLAGATGGTGLASPAAFALAGALTDPQFQMVVRALNQRKDVDLLSSPSITARDQEEASIDIVREFRYPTEFTPPQLPQNIGGAAGGAGGAAAGAAAAAPTSIPVTPTTPSAFVPRDTGVKLKVTPSIKGDNYAIDLDLRPEVTEFEGFINYGSPIQTVAVSSGASVAGISVATTPKAVTLTDNVINQPIFAVRRIQTNVTLLDGETIALGGLIREDVQKVNDKIPYLGDIPLLGRLFRSNVDQHIKKNLTIFVTARIIDASGQPLKLSKAETEQEEIGSLTQDQTVVLPSR